MADRPPGYKDEAAYRRALFPGMASMWHVEHATMCTDCGETLFGDETCESVDCPFAKALTAGDDAGGRADG